MYKISTKTDKPDIRYMTKRVREIMREGIKIGDVDKIYNYFLRTKNEMATDLCMKYGITNANSNQQIVEYLKSLKSVEVYDACCNDEGKWSSNKDNLSILAYMGYDIAKDLLLYRKAKKYSESIKSVMDYVDSEGRVHPTISLSKTNRINYKDPALMNIPKTCLWHVIVPRKKGNILFSADIKNQEPSIMINLLNIEELKKDLMDSRGLYESMFTKPFAVKTRVNIYVTKDNEPRIVPAKEMADAENIPPVYYTPIKPPVSTVYIHNEKVTLIEVCNTITKLGVMPLLPAEVSVETVSGKVYKAKVNWDKLDESKLKATGIVELSGTLQDVDIRCEGVERSQFKQAWNAMTYGSSKFGIEKMCKNIDGKLIYDYFSKIPEFAKYKNMCGELAKKGIQQINTVFGTTLYANEPNRKALQRVLMDLPIQGTGADILSLLIKHADDETRARGIEDKLRIYFPRHDEIIFEADGEWAKDIGQDAVINEIKDIMEHQINDWIPFKVEVKPVEKGELFMDDFSDEEEE